VALIATDSAYAGRIGIPAAIPPDSIKAIILVSGAFDLERLTFDGSSGWFERTVLWAYSGIRDFMSDERFRLASIVGNVSPAFPPAFITSGNGDPLEPQARRMVERLGELGVPVDAMFFAADLDPPLGHEYQFDLDMRQGADALAAMLAFLGHTIGGP
jgi:acetyl esterase/lipase